MIKNIFRELYQSNPVLTVTGWIHLLLFATLVVVCQFDSRTILGINPWIKPMKFSVSIAIFVWTLAWYLRYVSERRRTVQIISWVVAISMLSEIVCITLQPARGTTSHFNVATPLDAAIFAFMGSMIGINALLVAWTMLLFFVARLQLPMAYLWGIRLGLLVFLLASAEGVLMIKHGSHTVGAADGGPGLPFVNWSTEHGDLRVAHFAGMHALQILPLIGYWMSRSRRRETAQVAYTVAFSFLYLGVMVLLFWTAWDGRPLLAL
jgi:hypothetical protein